MARHHAKTNHSSKSSQKPEAPPPVMQPSVSVASNKPEAAPKQELASKPQAAPKQEAPAAQPVAAAKQPEATPVRSSPSDEQISRRAYELFLARGGEHGHHDSDWHQAERELQLSR